jgi:putative transcriptional regulator
MHRDNLRRARVRAGLTQAQVAALAGLSRPMYVNIELGRRNPSLDVAIRIAHVLGESVEALFEDGGRPTKHVGVRSAAI